MKGRNGLAGLALVACLLLSGQSAAGARGNESALLQEREETRVRGRERPTIFDFLSQFSLVSPYGVQNLESVVFTLEIRSNDNSTELEPVAVADQQEQEEENLEEVEKEVEKEEEVEEEEEAREERGKKKPKKKKKKPKKKAKDKKKKKKKRLVPEAVDKEQKQNNKDVLSTDARNLGSTIRDSFDFNAAEGKKEDESEEDITDREVESSAEEKEDYDKGGEVKEPAHDVEALEGEEKAVDAKPPDEVREGSRTITNDINEEEKEKEKDSLMASQTRKEAQKDYVTESIYAKKVLEEATSAGDDDDFDSDDDDDGKEEGKEWVATHSSNAVEALGSTSSSNKEEEEEGDTFLVAPAKTAEEQVEDIMLDADEVEESISYIQEGENEVEEFVVVTEALEEAAQDSDPSLELLGDAEDGNDGEGLEKEEGEESKASNAPATTAEEQVEDIMLDTDEVEESISYIQEDENEVEEFVVVTEALEEAAQDSDPSLEILGDAEDGNDGEGLEKEEGEESKASNAPATTAEKQVEDIMLDTDEVEESISYIQEDVNEVEEFVVVTEALEEAAEDSDPSLELLGDAEDGNDGEGLEKEEDEESKASNAPATTAEKQVEDIMLDTDEVEESISYIQEDVNEVEEFVVVTEALEEAAEDSDPSLELLGNAEDGNDGEGDQFNAAAKVVDEVKLGEDFLSLHEGTREEAVDKEEDTNNEEIYDENEGYVESEELVNSLEDGEESKSTKATIPLEPSLDSELDEQSEGEIGEQQEQLENETVEVTLESANKERKDTNSNATMDEENGPLLQPTADKEEVQTGGNSTEEMNSTMLGNANETEPSEASATGKTNAANDDENPPKPKAEEESSPTKNEEPVSTPGIVNETTTNSTIDAENGGLLQPNGSEALMPVSDNGTSEANSTLVNETTTNSTIDAENGGLLQPNGSEALMPVSDNGTSEANSTLDALDTGDDDDGERTGGIVYYYYQFPYYCIFVVFFSTRTATVRCVNVLESPQFQEFFRTPASGDALLPILGGAGTVMPDAFFPGYSPAPLPPPPKRSKPVPMLNLDRYKPRIRPKVSRSLRLNTSFRRRVNPLRNRRIVEGSQRGSGFRGRGGQEPPARRRGSQANGVTKSRCSPCMRPHEVRVRLHPAYTSSSQECGRCVESISLKLVFPDVVLDSFDVFGFQDALAEYLDIPQRKIYLRSIEGERVEATVVLLPTWVFEVPPNATLANATIAHTGTNLSDLAGGGNKSRIGSFGSKNTSATFRSGTNSGTSGPSSNDERGSAKYGNITDVRDSNPIEEDFDPTSRDFSNKTLARLDRLLSSHYLPGVGKFDYVTTTGDKFCNLTQTSSKLEVRDQIASDTCSGADGFCTFVWGNEVPSSSDRQLMAMQGFEGGLTGAAQKVYDLIYQARFNDDRGRLGWIVYDGIVALEKDNLAGDISRAMGSVVKIPALDMFLTGGFANFSAKNCTDCSCFGKVETAQPYLKIFD